MWSKRLKRNKSYGAQRRRDGVSVMEWIKGKEMSDDQRGLD